MSIAAASTFPPSTTERSRSLPQTHAFADSPIEQTVHVAQPAFHSRGGPRASDGVIKLTRSMRLFGQSADLLPEGMLVQRGTYAVIDGKSQPPISSGAWRT